MIIFGARFDQETADKLYRIGVHQGVVTGMSSVMREAIEIAYTKLEPKMTKATLSKKYKKRIK